MFGRISEGRRDGLRNWKNERTNEGIQSQRGKGRDIMGFRNVGTEKEGMVDVWSEGMG